MNQLVEKLIRAQKLAMSLRPAVGGFPTIAEVLRRYGVERNRWSLPSCQSIYQLNEGCVVQQGTPLVTGTYEIPKFDRDALIKALRADQEGRSTFQEFLQASWTAGVVAYTADFIRRRVTYFGALGESYAEDYPAVELQLNGL